MKASWGVRRSAAFLVSVVAISTATLLGGATAHAAPQAPSGAPNGGPRDILGTHDRELLSKAEGKRAKAVTLLIATKKGKAGAVARELTKLGGRVNKRYDRIGYVRATMPTTVVRKAAAVSGIAAIDLDENIHLPAPDPELKAAPAAELPAGATAPGPDTPASNPYLPANETGAVSFREQHREWDGRGATIGIMDTGVDLDHPALQKTSTGQRKIVDWFTATDPVADDDGTWRSMVTAVTGPSFGYDGGTWTAPAGKYRVNHFSELDASSADVKSDVNRDGDTDDKFGILYDPENHDIRVDANQNHDFSDDAVMAPYAKKYDVGHFGTDNPATAVREQMPFVVEYREDVELAPGRTTDFVNIGIVSGMHGTHVAGITAANDLLGNVNFDGAAPGAKLVSARACKFNNDCGGIAITEGMIELVANRRVDVVNMSIGGLGAMNDGNDAQYLIYNAVIDTYGVQLFFAAGNNGPGLNTVSDQSTTTDVVSVGASISKETWLSNYGAKVRKPLNLINFSSRGPREDGGFKPNIMAPGAAVSSAPLWQLGSTVAESGYTLPPGYQMQNGTSMASPQAAGAAALLVSAAKANDLGITPAALRRAIYSSAQWIDGIPALAQGTGQFNVPGAWALLEQDIEVRTYDVDAPVCTPLSGSLATPHRGAGIYNRCAASAGGVHPDRPTFFRVTVTRTSGPAGRIQHNLRWIGNDAFSSKQTVGLALNKPETILVAFRASAGAHSALLRVDDPRTPAVDTEILNTVVVSNEPAAPAYTASTAGTIDRSSATTFFVTVPEGAPALQVNLSGIATGSRIRFLGIDPRGIPDTSAAKASCYTNQSDPALCKPQERDIPNPRPGVWEFVLEASRTTPAMNNPFKLTARIQGVAVTPPVVQLPGVTTGQPTALKFSVKNSYGPVKVTSASSPLGSSLSSRPTITKGVHHRYKVVIPEGADRLEVSVGNTSDAAADLDLYVRLNGVEIARSADGDAEEAVSVLNPAAGTYEVDVDGFSTPSGSTAYDYRDVFYSSALGSLTAPKTVLPLGYLGTGQISASITALAAPTAGRQLFGDLTVVTDEGAIVGRGNVLIGSATAK